ncbi:thermonuclease family protein [Microterricola viridarii]|uniref:thermonuclease family protein n=1 Tax=Microterricola viridarii TaxID=412690 RepID=UPI00101AE255|nr:thermonuclease family protein [Microterricola viridarii]
MTSSASRRSRRRVNPWLRLVVPIALVVAATVAIWGPKIGWFDFGGTGPGALDSTSDVGAEPGAEPAVPAAPTATDAAPARPAEAVPVTVDYVHDGDTLFVYPEAPSAERIKVRLLGIDTPEVGDNAECFGAEATDALRALLPEGTTAWAQSDVNPQDKYGRSLLLMWTDDGRFVNNELLRSGAATVLQIDPNRAHTELFRASEESARAAGAGLWSAC